MKTKQVFLLIIALLFGVGAHQEAAAQETQALFLQEESTAVGAVGGYMSSGETTLGFGGVVMRFGKKYDAGILYSSSPSLETYGIQVGRLLSSSEDQKIPLSARIGGRLQVMQLDVGRSVLAGGVDFTAGIPLQQGAMFLQPTGTFSLSVVPVRISGSEVTREPRPSASVGIAVGASNSKMAVLVEPAALIPITEAQQETVFGVGASLLLNID